MQKNRRSEAGGSGRCLGGRARANRGQRPRTRADEARRRENTRGRRSVPCHQLENRVASTDTARADPAAGAAVRARKPPAVSRAPRSALHWGGGGCGSRRAASRSWRPLRVVVRVYVARQSRGLGCTGPSVLLLPGAISGRRRVGSGAPSGASLGGVAVKFLSMLEMLVVWSRRIVGNSYGLGIPKQK